MLDSVSRVNKKDYYQTLLGESKYEIKTKKKIQNLDPSSSDNKSDNESDNEFDNDEPND